MHKSATVNTRMETGLKKKAETILRKNGLTSAEAIRIFYSQICLRKGLPFRVVLPNEVTQKAMRDVESGKTHKMKNIDTFFNTI